MHHVVPRKFVLSSSNLRHCHGFLSHGFRECALCGVTLQQWTRCVTSGAICAHSMSGCATMDFNRFAIFGCVEVVINPSCQAWDMSSKGSTIFPGPSQHLKFGNSGVHGCRPGWGGRVRSSASTPDLVDLKPSGTSVAQKPESSGNEFGSVSSEEAELQEDRDRRERRLWEKGLRKNIYESLRKERITVELFPELSFALDGNYYPKLVSLIAQKINSLVEKKAEDEIAELLEFLGVTLNPHLVGEVLKSLDDWEKSLRFFVWAKYQPKYEHTAHTCNLFLCNLAKAKNEKPDDVVVCLHLLQEMVRKDLALSVVAVNIVVDRLCKARKTKVALRVMRVAEGNGVSLDLVTYNSIINGLGKAGKFKEVNEMVEEMEQKGVEPNLVTYNSIIHSLGNSDRWQQACRVFDELSDRGLSPNVVTYNSLIYGLYKGGQTDEAFKVFGLMALRGCEPDIVTYNSLIYGLARARRLDDALKIFNFMQQKNCTPDVVTYNTLIGELIYRNKFAEVSGLLVEMKEMGCTPDKITCNLLTEIGQSDKISALWRAEAVTDGPADNERGSRSRSLGTDAGS